MRAAAQHHLKSRGYQTLNREDDKTFFETITVHMLSEFRSRRDATPGGEMFLVFFTDGNLFTSMEAHCDATLGAPIFFRRDREPTLHGQESHLHHESRSPASLEKQRLPNFEPGRRQIFFKKDCAV